MENFSYRGTSIRFWKMTGEVISTQKYSDTHLSSSGGGGYVNQGGSGYISAPKIHSRVVTQHEFWLKTEDGQEVDIKLSDFDIPLREGQKITIISAGNAKGSNGWYSVLVNHNAGQHWFINNATSLNQKLKYAPLTITPIVASVPVFIAVAILALILWQTKDTFVAFVICIPFLFYALTKEQGKIKEAQQKLDRHLESLAQLEYSKP